VRWSIGSKKVGSGAAEGHEVMSSGCWQEDKDNEFLEVERV
jgi:hypothetical protein